MYIFHTYFIEKSVQYRRIILRYVRNITTLYLYAYTCNAITRTKMKKNIFAVRHKVNTTDRQIFVTFLGGNYRSGSASDECQKKKCRLAKEM